MKITIDTFWPHKWRFVDLETGDVWEWKQFHDPPGFKQATEPFPKEWQRIVVSRGTSII